MKKVLVLVVALMLVASGAMAANITGSSHDLSALATGLDGELCVFCHTPHGGGTQAPLWNRGAGVDITAELGYSAYVNANTLDATMTYTGDVPLCMSCHDGNMGRQLTNFKNASVTPTEAAVGTLTMTAGPSLLGVDMTNDHPAGFTYPADGVDAGLHTLATVNAASMLRGTNEVWCASCHNVHDYGDTTDMQPFLRVSNTNSDLCLTCHNK